MFAIYVTAASDASGSLAKLLDATLLAAGTPLDLIAGCRSMSKLDVRRRS